MVAGLETGRWYWAHMGFDFLQEADRSLVCAWGAEICRKLAIGDLGFQDAPSAPQIARLDCGHEVTLEQIASGMPHQRERIERDVAAANGLSMQRPLSIGRAIMLTGPQWRGFLQLRGPHRIAFEEAAEERAQASGA